MILGIVRLTAHRRVLSFSDVTRDLVPIMNVSESTSKYN